MNLKRLINDYSECNEFELKYKNSKLGVYFYDKINHFSDDKIEITKNKNKYLIEGKNLSIESMYKESIIISGEILAIKMGIINE